MLGCSREVGKAVHGGGWCARCWGHQHGQVWHLGQVDDACKRRWAPGVVGPGVGKGPGCLLAGPHPWWSTTALVSSHMFCLGLSTGPGGPSSEHWALSLAPLLLPSPVGGCDLQSASLHCPGQPFCSFSLTISSYIQSPPHEIPYVTSFSTWTLIVLGCSRRTFQKCSQRMALYAHANHITFTAHTTLNHLPGLRALSGQLTTQTSEVPVFQLPWQEHLHARAHTSSAFSTSLGRPGIRPVLDGEGLPTHLPRSPQPHPPRGPAA